MVFAWGWVVFCCVGYGGIRTLNLGGVQTQLTNTNKNVLAIEASSSILRR
jgi:hypothetical protein